VVREFQTPDTRKPEQEEGDTWMDRRLSIEGRERKGGEIPFWHFGTSEMEDGSDRAFDP
jgi:hypothetical protein